MVAKAGVRKGGVNVLDGKTGLRKPGMKAKGSAKVRVSAVASNSGSEEPPISAKETARIVKGLDAAWKQYPPNLEKLRGQVQEAVKRLVQKSWHVDPIVKKVAEGGLEEGYMQYAHEYKRKWAGKPAHKEFARREVLFGKSLLYAIQTSEAFHNTVFFMSGFFDYDEGEMFCSGHHGRKSVAQ
ncbi:hypothetical protein KFL_000530130 [Klebsormidium nitens]|uniref:Uncharacterized protein n=1 Tax=Klebsormidium nitens TaxID=105231 RepID=A0A1Y1HP22_KLENI|nr:hypothetical protein KFL_000530130 [Klebsormidium nitens]|eukprot:GAQ80385.1 hypothetical protein KFL_000530130 [Klebsormidium nitens]